MANQENQYKQLEELNGSDYQIVDGEPDITGWDVIDREGRKIGEVGDVLFDPQTRDVRYIIVDLEENELEIEEEKKVLVPIGIAELRDQHDKDETETETLTEVGGNDTDENDAFDEEDVVYLPSVLLEHLLALPAYVKDGLSPETETTIRHIFEPAATDTFVLYEPETFYMHEHFNNKIYPKNDLAGSYSSDRIDIDRGSSDKNLNE